MKSTSDQNLRAALYDATHRGQPGDVEYYDELCGPDHSVLELGCGSGRVLRSLSPRPGPLAGLDIDASLLAIARSTIPESVELHCADMRSFELDARFDRILLPFNGLYCLATAADIDRLFASVSRHLSDDGQFIFDIYPTEELEEDALHFGPDEFVDDDNDHLMDIFVGDKTYSVFEQSRWFPHRRRFEVTFSYRCLGSQSPPMEMTIVHDYQPLITIIAAAGRQGLKLLEHRHGFDDTGQGPYVLRFGPVSK